MRIASGSRGRRRGNSVLSPVPRIVVAAATVTGSAAVHRNGSAA